MMIMMIISGVSIPELAGDYIHSVIIIIIIIIIIKL